MNQRKALNVQKMSGRQLLENSFLNSAEQQYLKEGKDQVWIAKKLGYFCFKRGWYHSAANYYRKGGKRLIVPALKMVTELKKKGWKDTSDEIAILSGLQSLDVIPLSSATEDSSPVLLACPIATE